MKFVIIFLTTIIALTSARPTFDKIAGALLDLVDVHLHDHDHDHDHVYPNQHAYATPTHHQGAHEHYQQYGGGGVGAGGYYQHGKPNVGGIYSNGGYPNQPVYQSRPPVYPSGPAANGPFIYENYGGEGYGGYQSPPYQQPPFQSPAYDQHAVGGYGYQQPPAFPTHGYKNQGY